MIPNKFFSTHTIECVDEEFETLICKVLPFYCSKTDTIYFKDLVELDTLVGSIQDAYKLLFSDPYCFFSSCSLNTFFLSRSTSLKEALIAAIIELAILFPVIKTYKVGQDTNFSSYYFSTYNHYSQKWSDYIVVNKLHFLLGNESR
jgi:hypothetical protein